jgi:hypothetical protein
MADLRERIREAAQYHTEEEREAVMDEDNSVDFDIGYLSGLEAGLEAVIKQQKKRLEQ